MNIGVCRVSSVSQKDNSSIPHQKKMIGDYCKMYGIELNEIIEECLIGKTSNRDGLNHLRERDFQIVKTINSKAYNKWVQW